MCRLETLQSSPQRVVIILLHWGDGVSYASFRMQTCNTPKGRRFWCVRESWPQAFLHNSRSSKKKKKPSKNNKNNNKKPFKRALYRPSIVGTKEGHSFHQGQEAWPAHLCTFAVQDNSDLKHLSFLWADYSCH